MSASARGVDDIFVLTPTQEGLLYHSVDAAGAPPERGLYVEQYQADIDSDPGRPLDPERLHAAWRATVANHPALRTVFNWDKRERPLQVVRSRLDPPWQQDDWRGAAADRPDGHEPAWRALLAQDRARGFDLARGPLLRLRLLRLGEQHWRLLWSYHHICLDGWSALLLLDELWRRYAAAPEPAPPGHSGGTVAPSFHQLVRYRAGRPQQACSDYWREALAGFRAAARSPRSAAAARHAGRNGYGEHDLELPAGDYQRLRDTARGCRVTPNTLVCAAWAILLSRHRRQRRCVFGITLAGRSPALAGADGVVGLCIQTLPLALTLAPEQPVTALLEQVQRATLAAATHDALPLSRIQALAESGPGNGPGDPLFDTVVVFENLNGVAGAAPGAIPAETGLHLRAQRFHERSHYPLSLIALPGHQADGSPGDGLTLRLYHDHRHYLPEDAAALAGQLQALLSAIADRPARPLQALPLTTPEQTARLRALSSGDPLTLPPGTLIDLIRQRCASAAQRPALMVGDDGDTLDYQQLWSRAGHYCAALAAASQAAGDAAGNAGSDPGSNPARPVALCLPRSPQLIAALLGCLRFGAAYLPLDPTQPATRLEQTIAAADAALLITSSAAGMAPLSAAAVTCIDADRVERAAGAGAHSRAGAEVASRDASRDATCDATCDATVGADDPAYLLFTSGSSGQPKGVVVSHRNLLWSTLARHAAYAEQPGRFALLPPVHFDSSVAPIFWTLSSGGTLVLPAPGQQRDPAALARLIARREVSHLLTVPSLHAQLLEQFEHSGAATTLRCIIVAGEACPPALVTAHQRILPSVPLYNEYGPTETSVWCSVHRCGDSDVAIGRPAPGCRVQVLDPAGAPQPPGVPGEIVIGGPGVARYLTGHAPAQTAFRPDPERPGECRYHSGDLGSWRSDGMLQWLGRLDHQVKLRGHRIELGEIETALMGHAGVREAAVDLRALPAPASGATTDLRLIAWWVPAARPAPDAAQLRRHLAGILPGYMLPTHFEQLAALPRGNRGKLDRSALQLSAAPTSEHDAAPALRVGDDPLFDAVAAVWREVLGSAEVMPGDDFFALGGDSLLAMRVVSRLKRRFSTTLSPKDLFDHPGAGALSARLRVLGAGLDAGPGPSAGAAREELEL